MRRLLIAAASAIAAIGAIFYFYPEGAPAEDTYRLAKSDRGEIVATVTATGTINPITTVIVGSQLSGQVVEILADFNSTVQAGQVVARLNSDQIRARLDAARADLAQMRANRQVQEGMIAKVRADTEKARAAIADAEAQVARNEALLADSERIFQRQSELRTRGFAAQQTYDTARTTRDAQEAALNSARAQVLSARAALAGLAADLQVAEAGLEAVKAQIAQREAAVRQIEVDLRNTEIKSPVSGVVVQRNVELGQTVAASLQAPELFRIADDLRHMEIAAHIDETDVGRIQPGQRATFTVTAFPGRTFEGGVKQVRLGSQVVQNVVIYTAIISIENPRLELLPGMTASLRVETDRRENVLRVPNAALRWRPPATDLALGTAPAANSAGAPRGANAAAARLTEFVAAIKAELKPGAAQTKELEAALSDLRKSFTAGAADGASQTERRERARSALREFEERVAGLLDEGQRSRFEEIRKRFASDAAQGQVARLFVPGRGSTPQGVTVRVGATDGVMTEILSGLEAGRDVIVGGGPRSSATNRRPRFGF